MKKKIAMASILAVLMLITISFVSSADVNTNIEKKESPLYKIRTKLAIGEMIQEIRAKLFEGRIFFLPLQWLINRNDFFSRQQSHHGATSASCETYYKGGFNACYDCKDKCPETSAV